MSRLDFSQPRRQSVKGLILIFFQEGRNAIKIFWPLLVPLVLSKHSDNKLLFVGAALAAGVILLMIHTILYYWKFLFYIENQQFILRMGYLNRKTLTIPIDRIQNVNTNQTLVQQFLHVMSVEIDTAGSSKKELKIHALSKPVAVQLAMELSRYLESKQTVNQENETKPVPEEMLIMRLTNRDLLRIGISQNHLQTAFLIFIFGIQFYNQVKEYFKEKAEQYAQEAFEYISQSGWAIISSMIVFFLILSFLYSMVRTLVLYYDLRLYKLNQSYRIVSGLLNRKNLLIPFRKIQQLNWETGPVKKLFGIYKVNILQATSGVTVKTPQIELPGCLDKHIELLKSDLFGPDALKDKPVIHSNRVYFRRTWIYKGWVPAVLFSPLLFLDWRYILLLTGWILFMLIFSWQTLKKSYFQISNDQIRVSSGAISHKFKQMEFDKVQHLGFSQSIFYKKLGVASLEIGNASGKITIPFIDVKIARALHDYLLYYAETSNRFWM
ncbi:MAG: PH domain-containing protein [Bacteroidales bacterium]